MTNDTTKSDTMQVRLNGRPREVEQGLSIGDLLDRLELKPGMVVVELNREILERDRYADTAVSDGDSIELVHFVGGG